LGSRSDLLEPGFAAMQRRRTAIHHAEHHGEGEQHLDEQGQQDILNGHGPIFPQQKG
jgi:hypothetical protein